MKKYLSILKLLFLSVVLNAQSPEAPSWVDYTTKRANGDLKNSVLLDYSYAGYHFSEKELPDVSNWNTISVLDYGVTPNDANYDDAGIQDAINAAEAANVPTVVYFPAGRYIVSSNATQSIPIRVSGSHIVLKGAGSNVGGTEIYADVVGDVSARFNTIYKVLFKPNNTGSPSLTDIKNRINRGDTKIIVKDASKLSVGMVVALIQNEGSENVAINMAGLEIKPEWTDIIRTGLRINEKHIITAINGNEVVFKNPVNCIVTADISRAYLTEFRFIEEVGVEDILFTSGWKNYPDVYVHHANDVVDYGWRGLDMQHVLNGWIQNVEFRDWNESLRIGRSMNVTAKNIKISGKQGHVSYTGYTSSGVLFENCEDVVPVGFNNAGGQGHGLGLQVRSNSCVFLNSKMQQHQSVDFHGYQPYANLVDNLNGGTLRANGGSERSSPHHGPDLVFWNYEHSSNYSSKEFNFWDLSKRTLYYFPHPKFIGFTAPGENIRFKNEGLDELNGQQVYPQSLFDAQLQLRLFDGYMSASSSKIGRQAKYANDNDDNTRWNSNEQGVGQWLLLDFGVSKVINTVTLKELFDRIDNWKLEYWDETNWKILKTGNEIGDEKIITFNSVDSRKIRFTVLSKLPGMEVSSVSLSTFKIGGTLSKDDTILQNIPIKAYPSPNSGVFTLELPSEIKETRIDIYNIHSELLVSRTYNINNGKVKLNIEDKPSGIYFVKVNLEKPVFVKIVKQ